MVRAELKRAFESRAFRMTCGIVLVMLMYGSSDYIQYRIQGIIPTSWWVVYLNAIYLGMKTMLTVFYPIVVMIPHVLSYRSDRDSGYRQLILLKTSRKAYLGAKVLAVAGSAFMAILLPNLCWIVGCRLLGEVDPAYDKIRDSNIFFALSLYDQHPGLYVIMYAVHASILGTVFAILGLGLSTVIKNRYLAVLLPFCYCIFSSSILSSFINESFAALDLLPLQLYHYHPHPYPLGYWTVPVYEIILTIVGLVLFFGGDCYASKA